MTKQTQRGHARVAVLSALAISASTVAFMSPASATQTVAESRVAGLDRYATAAAVAQASSMANNPNIILVSGRNFPDGLAAAGLAGAAGAPILLTEPTALPSVTANAMAVVFGSATTKTVHILGGESAVSAGVAAQIASLGYTVNRVGGADRYATAALVASFQATLGAIGTTPVGGSNLRTAILATGLNFPDALAGGAPAYAGKHPILLAGATLPAVTRTALTSLGIQRVIILGGPTAVPESVATEVAGLGITVTRIAGDDRGATARALADVLVAPASAGGFNFFGAPSSSACLGAGVAGPNMVLLVDGDNYPDALAAAPHAGICKAPILIAGSASSSAFATANAAKIGLVRTIGGPAAVSPEEAAAVRAAATLATPTATISANQGNRVVAVSFSEVVGTTGTPVIRVNNAVIPCTLTEAATVPVTAVPAGQCVVVTLAGATTSTLFIGLATAPVAGDLISVSGFQTADARVAGTATTTVTTPATAPTLSIGGATIGSTTLVLNFSRPVNALDEAQILINGTPLAAAADVDVSGGRGMSFAVTVPALTASQAITVQPGVTTTVAGTPNVLAGNVVVTVAAAGARPSATSAVATVNEVGGVLNTTGILGTNVIIQSKTARPASGIGSLNVAMVAGTGSTTTAASATDATTGVTTITVTLAAGGSTAQQVASAINAGVGTLVTAFASDPLSTTTVGTLTSTALTAGSRTMSVVINFDKALASVGAASNVQYDYNGDTFGDVPATTVVATATELAAGRVVATFSLGVGGAPAPSGASTIRLASGAVTDLAGQTNAAQVIKVS